MGASFFVSIGEDRAQVIDRLLRQGVVVIDDAFSSCDARRLTAEARQLPLVRQPDEYGARRVRQAVSSADVVPGTLLWEFADAVQHTILDFFGSETFASPLAFTHRNVQHYAEGTVGIEPHRDESANRNIVVLCGLSGYGRFTVYEDLGGPLVLERLLGPGRLLLMVAPGFLGRDDRPVHGVDDIRGDRFILGLRHNVKETRDG